MTAAGLRKYRKIIEVGSRYWLDGKKTSAQFDAAFRGSADADAVATKSRAAVGAIFGTQLQAAN